MYDIHHAFYQLPVNNAKVPRAVRERSSSLYLACSDAFFVYPKASIVESDEKEGQLSQDCHATPSHATVFSATSPNDKTLHKNVDPKIDPMNVQDTKPDAHKSKLTNSDGIIGYGVVPAPCDTADIPTARPQLPEKNESKNATDTDVTGVQYLLCHEDTKTITLEAIYVTSSNLSSIPLSPQKKPAFKNYKSPTVEVFPEEQVQTPSRLNMQNNATSGPEKKKQAKRSKKARNEANTKPTARNLPKFTAKSPKRNATISRLDEGHRGQKNQQKAKKAKKAHESRFDLDEVMMDVPASFPEMAANSSNPSPKRRLQSTEAQQVAEKQPKRAKRCHQMKGDGDDVMMDVDLAESHIPTMAPPATPRATSMSLKRGVATPEAKEAAISSKTAKKPKRKHEGELPIDVCVEFEDITQLVDARMRETEEKREVERERREAAKVLKRSRGCAAAEAAEESAKKPKTTKEAKKPELRKALKYGLVSDEVAEKPKKKLKSEKDRIGGKLNLFSTIQSATANDGLSSLFRGASETELVWGLIATLAIHLSGVWVVKFEPI